MTDDKTRATFEAKKVYLKHAAFESPCSPQVFTKGEIQPNLDVQITMTHRQLNEDYYEVVLRATVNAMHDKQKLFLADVQQAGIFQIARVSADKVESVLETACPHVLLPFAREALASLIAKGGFPQLLISPINFQALYRQKKAKEARGMEIAATARPN